MHPMMCGWHDCAPAARANAAAAHPTEKSYPFEIKLVLPSQKQWCVDAPLFGGSSAVTTALALRCRARPLNCDSRCTSFAAALGSGAAVARTSRGVTGCGCCLVRWCGAGAWTEEALEALECAQALDVGQVGRHLGTQAVCWSPQGALCACGSRAWCCCARGALSRVSVLWPSLPAALHSRRTFIAIVSALPRVVVAGGWCCMTCSAALRL
jgi:hypothetical protein